jgi:hypothetical protein
MDGTPNKQGDIQFFTDLEVQMGQECKKMRFFLTDLGPQRIILGYPWFAATQPKIDWAKGWMDYDQLLVVLRTTNSRAFKITPRNAPRRPKEEDIYVGYLALPLKGQTTASRLAEEHGKPNTDPHPKEYKRHVHVFGEKESQ